VVGKRVFIETVGCPKNQEDSERMAGLLVAGGHEIVFDPDAADVIVVNTCGFIEAAKRESIETIFEFAPYKEAGKLLVVTGCLSQRYPKELAAELPEADVIIGVNEYEELPGLLAGSSRLLASEPSAPRTALSPRYSSYLKIAEGCSNDCAYCVIPSIRGPYRSVPMELLVKEAEGLAAEGCTELILIAQDLTWYGKDIYGRFALPELVRSICASETAKGIGWIRLLYCYPERVTDELIDVMASEPRLLNYIDMPLQHISDSILKNMRRLGTGRDIRDTIERLRAIPDMVIRTTFITGLPGETEEDFQELYNFVEDTRFDRIGVFEYSPEEGTDAAVMPGQVARETAAERRDALMRLGQTISLEKNEGFVGTVQEVIVDGMEGDAFIGRTRGDAPEIDNAVIFKAPGSGRENDDIIGRLVKVRITDAMDYDIVGELV